MFCGRFPIPGGARESSFAGRPAGDGLLRHPVRSCRRRSARPVDSFPGGFAVARAGLPPPPADRTKVTAQDAMMSRSRAPADATRLLRLWRSW